MLDFDKIEKIENRADVIRSLLEDSRKWWMRNCALLFGFWIMTLLVLVGVIVA